MKKGFMFSLNVIMLFSLLFLAAVLYQQRATHLPSLTDYLRAEHVDSTSDDVSEDLHPLLDLNVSQTAAALSIQDRLPATRNIEQSLANYAQFVQQIFAPPDLTVDFLSPGGQSLSLDNLNPPLQVLPFGFNYTYPTSGGGSDWGKRELQIQSGPSNFSYLNTLSFNVVANATFAQNFSGNCAQDWDSYKSCGSKTQYCLNASLNVTDSLGNSYAANCNRFDLKFQNQLTINFTGYAWMQLRLGQLDSANNVLDVRFSNLNITSNTTFNWNQTPFSLNSLSQVRTTDVATNTTLTRTK